MKPTAPQLQRYVDMWAVPGMHPSNIDFIQKLKTADTHHFTKNMNAVGTVSERDAEAGNWTQSHLVGIRTDIWHPNQQETQRALRLLHRRRKQELKQQIKKTGRLSEKQAERLKNQLDDDAVMQMQSEDIEQRRLVLKLFKTNSNRMRWCGTIEEVTITEVHNSIGSNRCLISLVVMLPRVKMVTYIQENHRTLRWPAIFSCGYYSDQRVWHVTLKQRWLAFGADFDIHVDGQRIGLQDSKLIGLGSDSHLTLDTHPLVDDTGFRDLLTLFAASTGYHRAMRRSIRRRIEAVQRGQAHRHLVGDEELRLRHNGRAAA